MTWPARVVDDWRLVAAQCALFRITALRYELGPYVLLYRLAREPLGIVTPDVRADNPEPHRFAAIFGFSVPSIAVLFPATGQSTVGWALVWAPAIFGGIAFFGWCAGCFPYYVLNRCGVGGSCRHAPVDGRATLGARLSQSGEA